jgi:CHRD domain
VSHTHCCAPSGSNAAVLFPFTGVPNVTSGSISEQTLAITPAQAAQLEAGMMNFDVHDAEFPGGGIRGQILPAAIPEPASLGLLVLGVLLMVVCAPKMRGVLAA